MPTNDFDKAEEFYGSVSTIAVMQSDAFGIEFQRHSHPIALHIDDVEAARAALEAKGVKFAADTLDSGVCHMAYFRTPTATPRCSATATRRRPDALARRARDARLVRVPPVKRHPERDGRTTEQARLDAVRRYNVLDSPPDGAFDRVCALAARFFDVPIATVTIVDEDRIWFKAAQGLDAKEIPREPGLCASAILADDAYVISDGLTDPRTATNSLVHGGAGVRFYAAAPITTSDGYRLGTINVIDSEPREASEEDRQTLRELAAVVMDELELRLAAIQQAQLERDRSEQALNEKRRAEKLARTLQRSLSPPTLPAVDGLESAVHYQPFSEDEVGGDFYDLFPLAPGRWGFFLGDVCGKGPEAASLTSLARYTLRTAAMLSEEPAAILRDLNTALLAERRGDMPMCTAVYGDIDLTGPDVALWLAVGGHPAPLVVRSGGSVEPITALGTLLGGFPEVELDTCRVSLGPGDAILVYSDGLLDNTLDGTEVDAERLAEILAGAAGSGAQGLVDCVNDVLKRLDRPVRDDVAVMALSRT